MRPAVRRFVRVVAFQAALLALAALVLDRVPPLVFGVVVTATIIERLRLRRASVGAGATTPDDQSGQQADATLLRGIDVARATGLDPDGTDPRAVATAFVDIERGELPDHPYIIGLHDEVRLLVDEDALAAEDPSAWSAEGPIGDAVLAQPEVVSVVREDREVVHARPAAAEIGPRQIHAAAVRALLDLHRRHPGDLANVD